MDDCSLLEIGKLFRGEIPQCSDILDLNFLIVDLIFFYKTDIVRIYNTRTKFGSFSLCLNKLPIESEIVKTSVRLT